MNTVNHTVISMEDIQRRAEELTRALGLQNESCQRAEDSKQAVPPPDVFRRIGDGLPVETRPKQGMVVRFDGEEYPAPKGDRVSIVPINDIHYGSLNCLRARFEAYLDYILRTPDTYAIGVGDLLELATKTSVGKAMFEEEVHYPKQLEYMADRLEPLARAGKLLGLQPGNHEYRATQMLGLDPMAVLARWIGVPFLDWQAYWAFHVGNQVYTAMTYHGKSGATTKGGKLNAVRKLNQTAICDLYVMGHTHDIIYDFDDIFVVDPETGEVQRRRRHYVVAGSLLSYFGGYPEMAAFPPSPVGLVRIDLLKDIHEIQVHY